MQPHCSVSRNPSQAPPPRAGLRNPAFAWRNDGMALRDVVGRRIREAREAAGITQEELALRSGHSKSTISRIEAGKTWPSDAMLESIVNELPRDTVPPLVAAEADASYTLAGPVIVSDKEKALLEAFRELPAPFQVLMAVADGLGRLSAIHRTLADIRDQGRPGTAAEETRTRQLAEALASRQSRG